MIHLRATTMLTPTDTVVRAKEARPQPWGRESAELLAMQDRFDSATLFEGDSAWHVREQSLRDRVEFPLASGAVVSGSRLIDLPGGQCIVTFVVEGGVLYVRCDASCILPPPPEPEIDEITGLSRPKPGEPGSDPMVPWPRTMRSTEPAEELTIAATSLAELLEWVMERGGAAELPDLGRLVDRLPAWMLMPPLSAQDRRPRSK